MFETAPDWISLDIQRRCWCGLRLGVIWDPSDAFTCVVWTLGYAESHWHFQGQWLSMASFPSSPLR